MNTSDVFTLTVKNSKRGDYIIRIERDMKDTTNTVQAASYLDLHFVNLEIYNEGRLKTKFYVIMNFPFLYNNYSSAPAYGVFISLLI